MKFDKELLTGTLIHYFATCKREAWLYSRKISANQEDENISMGKALADIKEEKLQDFPFSNLQFDKVAKLKGHYLVTEYKKSLKNREGAKMQLLFYMWQLKTGLKLKEINGKIISGKTVISVRGDEPNFEKIEKLIDEIVEFLNTPKPPPAEKIVFCKKCGYRDYCY